MHVELKNKQNNFLLQSGECDCLMVRLERVLTRIILLLWASKVNELQPQTKQNILFFNLKNLFEVGVCT